MRRINYPPHNYKHGLSKTRIYRIYYGILDRCYHKSCECYQHYGGRGILCEWTSFEDFYSDMIDGYNDNLEIDRIDVNGNYSKENCRWATRKEQMNNYRKTRYVEHNGKKYTLREISDTFNIPYYRVRGRVNAGHKWERIIFDGVHKDKVIVNGRTNAVKIENKTIMEISELFGITPTAIYLRIKKCRKNGNLNPSIEDIKNIINPIYYAKKRAGSLH